VTGRIIGSPRLVATYPSNGPCGSGWSVTGSLGLIGFSPDGNRLYDDWFCVAYDDNTGYYYTRWLNQKTGALGPDLSTFAAGGGNGSFSWVNLTPKVILNYYVSADYAENTLDVYPLTGGTTPLFSCTADMFADCGDSVEPSGNYISFYGLSGGTDIAKLDLPAQEIVSTGSSLGDGILAFSPDSTLIYTEHSFTSPFILPIYTFDLATGVANAGGQIVVEKSQDVVVVPAITK